MIWVAQEGGLIGPHPPFVEARSFRALVIGKESLPTLVYLKVNVSSFGDFPKAEVWLLERTS